MVNLDYLLTELWFGLTIMTVSHHLQDKSIIIFNFSNKVCFFIKEIKIIEGD